MYIQSQALLDLAEAQHRLDLAGQLVRAAGRRLAQAVNSRDLERIGRAWRAFSHSLGLAWREGVATLGALALLIGGVR